MKNSPDKTPVKSTEREKPRQNPPKRKLNFDQLENHSESASSTLPEAEKASVTLNFQKTAAQIESGPKIQQAQTGVDLSKLMQQDPTKAPRMSLQTQPAMAEKKEDSRVYTGIADGITAKRMRTEPQEEETSDIGSIALSLTNVLEKRISSQNKRTQDQINNLVNDFESRIQKLRSQHIEDQNRLKADFERSLLEAQRSLASQEVKMKVDGILNVTALILQPTHTRLQNDLFSLSFFPSLFFFFSPPLKSLWASART
eukprot:TRINITY_DN10176_c0_g1_i1.p1 TRINITY_DN10176_c0_g1~~TRINITY_DN10176_c0_g1_i1.p1  ORF type:complete len:275 (-),score=73.39 TRINITY_DN10176_c0_g1_i1:99-869(-)